MLQGILKYPDNYSGDLNNKQLNNENIWIAAFKSPVFRSSAIQMHSSYYLLDKQVVNKLSAIEIKIWIKDKIAWYSDHHSNNRTFDYRTTFDQFNPRLVLYSDPTVYEYSGERN